MGLDCSLSQDFLFFYMLILSNFAEFFKSSYSTASCNHGPQTLLMHRTIILSPKDWSSCPSSYKVVLPLGASFSFSPAIGDTRKTFLKQ